MAMATTAMPTGVAGRDRRRRRGDGDRRAAAAIVIDEPGVLDDNTFVDAGDSLWVATDDDRESTFALDVDTGSFNVAQTFLANGYRPEPDSIRPEEWVNAFDYGDAPATDADLAITVESATAPTPATARRSCASASRPASSPTTIGRRRTSRSSSTRPARWTSASASASCSRRWPCSSRSLRPDDTIAIVTYGDVATPAARRRRRSPSGRASSPPSTRCGPSGSTNMEAGLLLGYEQARESFDPDALNVVVLASDGVANQGVTDPEVLTDADHPGRRRGHPPRHRRLRHGQLQRPPDGAARRPGRRLLLLRRHVRRGRASCSSTTSRRR